MADPCRCHVLVVAVQSQRVVCNHVRGPWKTNAPEEPEQGPLQQQVPVDIVLRPNGVAFDPAELIIPAGSMVIWTNHTTETQAFQIGRRAITLAPHGQEGSVSRTRSHPDTAGPVTGQLQANPAAQITVMHIIAEAP